MNNEYTDCLIFNATSFNVTKNIKSNFGIKSKNIDLFRLEVMINRLKELDKHNNL